MGLFSRLFSKKAMNYGKFMPNWFFRNPVPKEWDFQNAINEGYKKNNLVYSCIDKIAKSASSVDWYVYRKKRDGSYEKIENHPLEKLLAQPNPFTSKRDFISRYTYAMFLGGNSITYKVKNGKGETIELWYLPQDTVSPVPHPTRFIEKYVYDFNGIKQNIDPSLIMHDTFIDPSNLYWGISPIKSAATIIDTDNASAEWNKQALNQRAISDGAFIIDQPLTKDQWEEISSEIQDQHAGPENARKFWVLGAGAKWTPMSMSPVEMDFINSKKLNREDICAIFGVPPAMAGYYDNATYNNVETAREVFWLDTVIPYLNGIRDCLNSSLAKEYGDVYIDYDTSTVPALQTSIGDKITTASSLFSMGVPFNEINTLLDMGFDDIEGGDVGYLASNLIPIERVNEPPQPAPSQLDPNAQDNPNNQNDSQNQNDTPPKGEEDVQNSKALLLGINALKSNLNSIPKIEIHHLSVKERQKLPYDNRMTNSVANLFMKMGDEIDPLNVDKSVDNFTEQWTDILVKTWQAIFEDVGRSEYLKLMNESKEFTEIEEHKLNIFQALFDKTILNWIKTTCAEKVKGIQNVTKKKLSKAISDLEQRFQKEGKRPSIEQYTKAVRESCKDMSRYRANTIARTEVGSATESASYQAQHLAQQQIDPTGKKILVKRKWISAMDERTRETHKEVHGQVRGLEEKFDVGETKLAFPRDYDAGVPNETINCRCTTISFVERAK